MDDIFTVISNSNISSKLHHINQLHDNLKFTIEMETEGRLHFLDLCLIHTGNRVQTTWYSKPTDTGLIMNFHAVAPRRYKRAVIQGFVHRIARACSSWETFHESICRAKQVLERNQYPPEFYDPIISTTIDKLLQPVSAPQERTPSHTQQSPSQSV